MAAVGDNAPIIIKKIKKGGHGHHGGAWKVAYADFVTAMMAFFLLLWLLNATTDEQKQGIADYFTPSSVSKSHSGGGGVMGGKTLSREGVMARDRSAVNVTVSLPSDTPNPEPENEPSDTRPGDRQQNSPSLVDREQIEEALAKEEDEQLKQAEDALTQAIESMPELKALADNLLVEQTPEGLRIQIVDHARYSMFPLGSAEMYDHTKKLLGLVTAAIKDLPQEISIKGHTDATPYSNARGYSNWELSTDRANASRRALIAAGLPEERIESVAGRAAQEPLIAEDPFSARNRRISITLLREHHHPRGKGESEPVGSAKPAKRELPPRSLLTNGR